MSEAAEHVEEALLRLRKIVHRRVEKVLANREGSKSVKPQAPATSPSGRSQVEVETAVAVTTAPTSGAAHRAKNRELVHHWPSLFVRIFSRLKRRLEMILEFVIKRSG